MRTCVWWMEDSPRLRNSQAGQCALDRVKPITIGRACYVVLVFLLTAGPVCSAKQAELPAAQTQQLEPCGLFSDLRVPSLLVPGSEPTAIRIMPSRYRDLRQTKDGYDRTGVALVAFDGTTFVPAGFSDDPGMYYYILLISRAFHLSLARSISAFFVTVLVLSAVVGFSGLLLVLRGWPSRIFGIATLIGLTFVAYRLGDVYLFEFAVPIAVIPWIMWQVWRRTHDWRTNMLLVVVGVVIGLGATVRTVAGVPALLFVLVLVATQFKVGNNRKVISTCLLSAGVLCPVVYLHHVESERNAFLLTRTAIQADDLSRHAFWHFAYIGLGFVNNPYVPGGVCDEIGKAKVRAIAPEAPYLSGLYDGILRHEVLAIAADHLSFVFLTIAAKLGVVVVIIAVFGSVGLVAVLFRPVSKSVWATFWPALLASGLPVVMVAPSPQYLVSLITFASMCSVFCFDEALQPVLAYTPEAVEPEHTKYLTWWSSVKDGRSV